MKKATPNTPTGKSGPTTVHIDTGPEVRAMARERIGPVKPGQVIPDKRAGKKPGQKPGRKAKHKLPAGAQPEAE